MSDLQLAQLTQQVLWAAFLVSAMFGAVVQRTGFCTMGAISDVVAMGDWTRMRQWALAAGAACIGFASLAALGLINPAQSLYVSSRWLWLSALTGGAMFGFGMVLSSGCASKSLVRVGGGSLKSLVVVLVVGITGFATLKGLTAVWRVATVDRAVVEFAGAATVPGLMAQVSGAPLGSTVLWAGLVAGGALACWALASRSGREGNSLLAGLGVGACVVALWWISGHLGRLAEHPQTLEEAVLATNSGRSEALSFVSPIAYLLDWLMFYSDTNKRLTVGIVSVLGVVAGSALTALAQRSFRWQGFADVRDLSSHLVGGALMGVGGVTAMGCSIGHGVSGISALSLTSLVAVAAIVAGAWAALRYQQRVLERLA